MTVRELIDALNKMLKASKVYMVVDVSPENYNEDGKIIAAHAVEYVIKEVVNGNDGWENEREVNVLLQIEEP